MSFSHCDIGVQTVTPFQVATMMEVQLFRHPRWAEDAHGAFHRWCLWQRAAFRLPANRWCRLPSWHFHSLSSNEGFSKVSSELLHSAATSMVTLFSSAVRLVRFLRHALEGVCLPPAFSTQPMQRSPVGFELGCLKN